MHWNLSGRRRQNGGKFSVFIVSIYSLSRYKAMSYTSKQYTVLNESRTQNESFSRLSHIKDQNDIKQMITSNLISVKNNSFFCRIRGDKHVEKNRGTQKPRNQQDLTNFDHRISRFVFHRTNVLAYNFRIGFMRQISHGTSYSIFGEYSG